ncbi:class I SAM-dependent methyltransferase [Clostridium sp. 19966]|uniref:class I SAM-dependent methyltransferase n=1 Tax=Clostridium sp. 19966 TaxID=2768166 RepID=UPI0028E5BB7A|nr:class I SAM-dependent methyltransferase [Clostridium sp. 19966]
MIDSKQFWNDVYEKKNEKKPSYDLWLEDYKEVLNKCSVPVIDLGCGTGGDTLYLTERGHKVIACDQSQEALNIINSFIPQVKTIQMDISKPLPFEDESAEVIIADLSLHYFNHETTQNIVKEIKRVLKNKGYLLGRVNSINDFNFGAGSGEEIERNFYLTQDGNKRFFSEEDIKNYFQNFSIEVCEEKSVLKYGKEKRAFEFVVRNM